MVKPVFSILLGYPVGSGLNNALQGLAGTGLSRAQRPGWVARKHRLFLLAEISETLEIVNAAQSRE